MSQEADRAALERPSGFALVKARGVLPYRAVGALLADVVAPIGTIDIVLGSVDR